MPRFGIKSLLISFAVVALWLSTFADYSAAHDVRSIIFLTALLASAFKAAYCRGRKRAFWTGFFMFFLVCAIQPKWFVVPNFNWLDPPASRWAQAFTGNLSPNERIGREKELLSAIRATIWIAIIVPLSTLFGFITARMYDQRRMDDQRTS
jgi:hypothetical protein